MIYAAVMGHGTVGSGVAEIMINSKERLSEKIKEDIELKYILDIRDFNNLSYSEKFTKDFNDILNDESVKIVAEVMGGINPAYDFVKSCLQRGKSVVTSNKELVAAKGAELLKIAKEKNVNFMFEASVGGGIPILRPLNQCLAANKINEICGILNGTTNYILNKMIVDNMDFDTALKLAQDNGFAEKNPAADIEGHDAARKIAILSSLAFGKHVYPESVKCEGITDITLADIENADKFDCVIKLIGRAKQYEDGKISVCVAPMLLDKDMILSNVNGVFNAILVNGDATGDVMFYGKGAGKMATASAVVADILDCAKHLNTRKYLFWEDSEQDFIVESNEPKRLYVSLKSKDFDKLLKSFNSVFTNNTWHLINKDINEIAFITEKGSEKNLKEKINTVSFDSVKIIDTLI